MRKKMIYILSLLILSLIGINLYYRFSPQDILHESYFSKEPTQIYLYGEYHGRKDLIQKEFEIWQEHYHQDKMRHLFLEVSYSKAQLLNRWMQADNDELIELIDKMSDGTQSDMPETYEFYKKLK